MDLMRHGIGARTTTVASAIVVALLVCAPRVGEPDRTESMAIGMLRAIVSGAKAFASVNDGYFDTPACLATPSCIAGTTRGSGPFLAPTVLSGLDRRGYQIQFEPGPKAEHEPGNDRSPSAMTGFTVVAIPTTTMASRHRAFCADDRGTIYVTLSTARPDIAGGRCVDTSRPLR